MYEYRFHKTWVKRYGKNIGEELIRQLHAVTDQIDVHGRERFEYADHFRVCRVGDKEDEQQYEEIYNHGCCGYKDWEVEIGGIKYKLGFNYGH